MGRGSQVFWFLNAEKAPTVNEMKARYSHISRVPELVRMRKEFITKKRMEAFQKGDNYGHRG